MNPTTTTPDYIKQRAEALYPYDLENTIGQNRDNQLKKEGYLKGCTDTLEGSAGSWVPATKVKIDFNKTYWLRITHEGGAKYKRVGSFHIDMKGAIYYSEPLRNIYTKDIEILDESVPYTPPREVCEGLAKALNLCIAALKWTMKEMSVDNKDLQSDAFNIPANAIEQAENSVEKYIIQTQQQ